MKKRLNLDQKKIIRKNLASLLIIALKQILPYTKKLSGTVMGLQKVLNFQSFLSRHKQENGVSNTCMNSPQ